MAGTGGRSRRPFYGRADADLTDEDLIAEARYHGGGRVPLHYIRFCYCRDMHVTEREIDWMLAHTPGVFGRHLRYQRVEAETPTREA